MNFPQNERRLFVDVFGDIQTKLSRINVANGFWDARMRVADLGPQEEAIVILSCIALVDSEMAEASEAVRKHDRETWGDASNKDTLVRELAGACVRIMDLAEHLGLPLAEAIVEEVEANSTRGYMHGGKKA